MKFLKKLTQGLARAVVSKEEILDVVNATLARLSKDGGGEMLFRSGVRAAFFEAAEEALERGLISAEISEAVKHRMEEWPEK